MLLLDVCSRTTFKKIGRVLPNVTRCSIVKGFKNNIQLFELGMEDYGNLCSSSTITIYWYCLVSNIAVVFCICSMCNLYQLFNCQMFTSKHQLHIGKIKSEPALLQLDIYRFHALIQNLRDIFSSVKESTCKWFFTIYEWHFTLLKDISKGLM